MTNLQMCSKKQRKEFLIGDADDLQLADILQGAIDDVLFEIFVRIPNCRSVICCSYVSHRWHSLVSHPRFIPRFISQHNQHQDRYPPAYNIIFRKSDRNGFGSVLNFQPIWKLSSDESMLSRASYLDFLPLPMVIRASCGDLLLMTPGSRSSSVLYICNPVTKQFYELAQNHWLSGRLKIFVCGFALVCMPEESECHFKVLLFNRPFPKGSTIIQRMTIYCSKLGKWESKVFNYPRPGRLSFAPTTTVFSCNGILYWLESEFVAERIVSFDLSRSQCVIIDFPHDFGWVGSRDFCGKAKKQIGTVDGEVRLVQVVLKSKDVYLKVWKLIDNDSSLWVLLHEKKCKRSPNKEKFVALFVHPTDGDKVFIVWGKQVFQYDLKREKKYEMMADVDVDLKTDGGHVENNDWLVAFSMVHPAWPTQLPSLPSTI